MILPVKISRRSFLIGLAAATASSTLRAGAAGGFDFAPFSFAYITDCHLVNGVPDSYKLTQESQLFLQNAIQQVNNLGVDFVVFGGDQVETPGNDDANWNLFMDIAQGLSAPWYFVLGERDVSGIIPVDKIKTYGPDWKHRDLTGDKPYWSLDVKPGVHLIGLDTAKANSDEGYLDSEQLSWLQKDLDEAKGKFTVVFCHHPLLAPPPFDGGPPWDNFLVPQGASAREILASAGGVRLVVSGHVHTSKIQREKDIWHVSSPSLDIYPCEFRLFNVAPTHIDVETFQIDYPALVKKARTTLASSRLAFEFSSTKPAGFLGIAEGDHLDQSASLPLTGNRGAEPLKVHKTTKPKKDKQPAKPEGESKAAPADSS